MHVNRRTFLAGTAGLLGAGRTGSACAQATKNIKVGHTAAVDYAPAWVAVDKGYFSKRNLNVAIEIVSLNPMIPAALQSNSIDIGTPTVSVLLQAITGGLDLVAIAGSSFTSKESKMFGVVAGTKTKIAKAEDLVGKRVAFPGLLAFQHVLFRQWLIDKGIDYTKVQQIEVPLPQMNDALRSGNVDAVVLSEPNMSRITTAGNGNVISYYTQELPDHILTAPYCARRDWAERNRDSIEAFRAGLKEGVAYAREHTDDLRALTEKTLKLPKETVAGIAFPVFDSELSKADIEFWIDMLTKQGILKGKVKAEDVLFT
jgi:NitT/TauT family transport system substrate-binding protein